MKTDDLLGYLFDKFTTPPEPKPDNWVQSDKVEDFIEFCRKFMKDHPPSSIDYTLGGLGLLLSNGDRLKIVSNDADDYNIYQPEVCVFGANRRDLPMLPDSHFVKV